MQKGSYEKMLRTHPIMKSPMYSRTSKWGTTAEEAYAVITSKAKSIILKNKQGEQKSFRYFPKYNIYINIFHGYAPWSIPTINIYATSEKAYQKFRLEIIKPALDKLWR